MNKKSIKATFKNRNKLVKVQGQKPYLIWRIRTRKCSLHTFKILRRFIFCDRDCLWLWRLIRTHLMTWSLVDHLSIPGPEQTWAGIRFDFAFEDQTLGVVFLANGRFLGKSWSRSINLSKITQTAVSLCLPNPTDFNCILTFLLLHQPLKIERGTLDLWSIFACS